jgi:hypothetical protein
MSVIDEAKPPQRIYLQRETVFADGWTWCVDKINDEDPEYICLEQYEVVEGWTRPNGPRWEWRQGLDAVETDRPALLLVKKAE